MEVEEYKQERGCEKIMCERERARKEQDRVGKGTLGREGVQWR